MDIEVIYKDSASQIHNQNFKLPILGLLKHFGLAGQNYGTTIRAIRRAIGAYFLYHDYFKRSDLQNSRFSRPRNHFYDPTEQGDFSTIAGRAISDFLARRISKATHTVTYEGAMLKAGFPNVNIKRPDLYCFNSSAQFAIESKGFDDTSVSDNEMNKHKTQSKQGPLNIQFSVASVSYNIYSKVKNKYYDPVNDNSEFNFDLNLKLSQEYYSGFAQMLQQQTDFPELRLSSDREFKLIPIYSLYDDYFFYDRFWRPKFSNRDTLFLVLDKRVSSFAREGFLSNDTQDIITEDGLYIDNDGVGLLIDF
jgi:hypothetical protein